MGPWLHECKGVTPESAFKEFKAPVGWPWWISVLLWFKKPYHGYDSLGGAEYVRVTAKYLFGKVYIVKEERGPNA